MRRVGLVTSVHGDGFRAFNRDLQRLGEVSL